MSVGLASFRRFSDARRIELQYPARRIEFRTVSSYAFGTQTMHRQYSVPGCTIVLMRVHNRAGVCIYPQNGTAVTYGDGMHARYGAVRSSVRSDVPL
jgi:hypothetical protein